MLLRYLLYAVFTLCPTYVLAIDDARFKTQTRQESACSGATLQSIAVTSQPDYITSPGFPSFFYPGDSLCRWNLTAPINSRIQLTSELFMVERTPSCLFDHLVILDGPNDNSAVLGRFCGNDAVNVVTSSNHAFVIFFSDMSYENRGFRIEFKRTTLPRDDGNIKDPLCNQTILTDSKFIHSPDYPLPYPSNTRCSFSLQAPDDYVIEVIFKHFTLEHDRRCTNDFLAIYDGPNENSQLLGRYCGSEYPETVRSQYNEMYIYFQSDAYYELGGFNLTSRFLSFEDLMFDGLDGLRDGPLLVSGDPDCSAIHDDPTGTISSPNYPAIYAPLKKCVVIIRAPVGHVIRIEFNDFLLEDSQDCEFDWLRILDGERSDSPVVGRYCSQSLSGVTRTSHRNTLRLEFQSDVSVEYRGFEAEYQFIKQVQDCPLLCANSGVCKEDVDGSHCACPTGWSGKLCGRQVTSCGDKPCIHGGVCSRTPLAYRCRCSKEYEGKHCESRTSLRFTSSPQNHTVDKGDQIFIQCAVNDNNAQIIWSFDDDVFFHDDDDMSRAKGVVVHPGGVLEVTSFNDDNTGKYTCTAKSETEEIATDCWLIMDKPCPQLIQTSPTNATVLQESTHRFMCVVAFNGVSIAWEKDDARLPLTGRIQTLINGMLVIDEVRLSDAGKYKCVARSPEGCVKRKVAWLNVRRHDNLDEICGRVQRQGANRGRITNGTQARDGAHPWFTLMHNPRRPGGHFGPFCGATLIDRDWVVTAAHCLHRQHGKLLFTKSNTRLYFGTNDCYGRGGVQMEVERVVIHPDFGINDYDNDIALLKIAEPLQYTKRIVPVCLKPKAYIDAQFIRRLNKGMVVGCGVLSEQGHGATKLNQVNVPLRSRAECRAATNTTVTRGMLCAGYRRQTRGDSCQGDSGGPYVMRDENDVAVLVGIVSWGEGCDRANKFGYYTNVGMYYDWINEMLVQYGDA